MEPTQIISIKEMLATNQEMDQEQQNLLRQYVIDLEKENERARKENEIIKASFDKARQKINDDMNKRWEFLSNADDPNWGSIDDYKYAMAEASTNIIDEAFEEIEKLVKENDVVPPLDPVLFTRCKYLEDLGVKEYFMNFDHFDFRKFKWQKERAEYGFDSRETWNIDYRLAEWIYTRFKMYVEVCNVNLDWEDPVKWKMYPFKDGEETKYLTKRQAIDLVLNHCEKFLTNKFVDEPEIYKEFFNDNFWTLFGHLLPAMWW